MRPAELEPDELEDRARRVIEQVCARGDFELARELYSADFVDHVNAMEFRGQTGIRESVGLYLAIFPDLRWTPWSSRGSWACAGRPLSACAG